MAPEASVRMPPMGDHCMFPEVELRNTASPLPGQVALYRFYDPHEALLYVGISNDPRRRWKEHAQEKSWYPRVRHQALTWYDSEPEARRAETRAIRRERPQFNVAGAIRPERARFTFRPHRWACFAWAWVDSLLLLTCLLLVIPPTPFLRKVLIPFFLAVTFMAPVVSGTALLVIGAPWLRRFAAWIERNSISYPGTPDANSTRG
jgi:predicted GIY-YIG superfamily endonuclease